MAEWWTKQSINLDKITVGVTICFCVCLCLDPIQLIFDFVDIDFTINDFHCLLNGSVELLNYVKEILILKTRVCHGFHRKAELQAIIYKYCDVFGSCNCNKIEQILKVSPSIQD